MKIFSGEVEEGIKKDRLYIIYSVGVTRGSVRAYSCITIRVHINSSGSTSVIPLIKYI